MDNATLHVDSVIFDSAWNPNTKPLDWDFFYHNYLQFMLDHFDKYTPSEYTRKAPSLDLFNNVTKKIHSTLPLCSRLDNR
ncbi:hypothetical protein AKO1_003674, partial [Acrasis kona]